MMFRNRPRVSRAVAGSTGAARTIRPRTVREGGGLMSVDPTGTVSGTTRRGFLGGAALAGAAAAAAACAPAAAPPASPAPAASGAGATAGGADWQKQWDDLVAAAKKEGSLSLVTYPGTQFRKFADVFEKAFPGITVDQTGNNASTIVPKIIQERQAGVYSVDVLLSSVTTPLLNLRPANALEPVRPLLFRPDIMDDSVWNGGYEAGFLDKEKKMMYARTFDKNLGLW